jgi:hypothetical protein
MLKACNILQKSNLGTVKEEKNDNGKGVSKKTFI